MKRLLFITLLLFPCLAQAQHTLDINVWNLDWPTTYTPEIVRNRRPVADVYFDSAYAEYRALAQGQALTRKQFDYVARYEYDMAGWPKDVNINGLAVAMKSNYGYDVFDNYGNKVVDVTIIPHKNSSTSDPRVSFLVGTGKRPLSLISLYW